MFGLLKKLFGGKPAEVTQPEAAPYKVEQVPTLTEVVEAPKAEAAPVAETKKKAPAKKKAAPKQNAPKQPKKDGAKKGGRKPKSKPQA